MIGLILISNAYAECAQCKRLQAEFERALKDMQESVTPWGAEYDLDNARDVWSRIIFHAKTCPECRREICNGSEQDIDEEIRKTDEAVRERLAEIQREINKGKEQCKDAFLFGWNVLGPIIFGG